MVRHSVHRLAGGDAVAGRDKRRAKHLMHGRIAHRSILRRRATAVPKCTLPWPVIVKPAAQDASVGIDQNSVVTNQQQLRTASPVLVRYGTALWNSSLPGAVSVELDRDVGRRGRAKTIEVLPPARSSSPTRRSGRSLLMTPNGRRSRPSTGQRRAIGGDAGRVAATTGRPGPPPTACSAAATMPRGFPSHAGRPGIHPRNQPESLHQRLGIDGRIASTEPVAFGVHPRPDPIGARSWDLDGGSARAGRAGGRRRRNM